MSRFFVGQRVRLVRSSKPELLNIEGHIVALGDFGSLSCVPFPLNVRVQWDRESDWCHDNTDRLEPILPEGSAPSEFTTLRDLLNSLEGVAA